DLGNLVSRTTAMIARYAGGRIAPGPRNEWLASALEGLRGKLVTRFDVYDLTGGLEDIWEVVRLLNRYVEEKAPWHLANDQTNADDPAAPLYHLPHPLRAAAA